MSEGFWNIFIEELLENLLGLLIVRLLGDPRSLVGFPLITS